MHCLNLASSVALSCYHALLERNGRIEYPSIPCIHFLPLLRGHFEAEWLVALLSC